MTLEADKFMNEFKDSPEWKVENKNPFRWPHTFAAKCAAAFARRQVVEELCKQIADIEAHPFDVELMKFCIQKRIAEIELVSYAIEGELERVMETPQCGKPVCLGGMVASSPCRRSAKHKGKCSPWVSNNYGDRT
jgi:hypothetical protein